MGSEYFIYSEAKFKGEWITLSPWVSKYIDGAYHDIQLAATYECLSGTSFFNSRAKIWEIGKMISTSDMSTDLVTHLKNEFEITEDEIKGVTGIAIPLNVLQDVVPNEEDKKFSGYVTNTDYFKHVYEDHTIDDWMDAKEFNALDPETRLGYRYFEWDDFDDWSYHFKEILKSLKEDMKRWSYVNLSEDFEDVRIVVFEF